MTQLGHSAANVSLETGTPLCLVSAVALVVHCQLTVPYGLAALGGCEVVEYMYNLC